MNKLFPETYMRTHFIRRITQQFRPLPVEMDFSCLNIPIPHPKFGTINCQLKPLLTFLKYCINMFTFGDVANKTDCRNIASSIITHWAKRYFMPEETTRDNNPMFSYNFYSSIYNATYMYNLPFNIFRMNKFLN